MFENNPNAAPETTPKRFGLLQVLGFIVVAAVVAAGLTVLVIKTYFFPSAFKPVTLNPQEEHVSDR